MPRLVRAAKIDELAALSELCMRSKALWGYDKKFLDACRAELSFNLRDLKCSEVAVAEEDDRPVGVVQVEVKGSCADLLKLFVEPGIVGRGVGGTLFRWATRKARQLGADRLFIDSDPHASAFYRQMGAQHIGLSASGSIPGRMLPRLVLKLRLAP
jgi:N-acetylglutamate synthase-like GNAT family acetyltransferase